MYENFKIINVWQNLSIFFVFTLGLGRGCCNYRLHGFIGFRNVGGMSKNYESFANFTNNKYRNLGKCRWKENANVEVMGIDDILLVKLG